MERQGFDSWQRHRLFFRLPRSAPTNTILKKEAARSLGKGKVHHRTGHEDPKGEYCSSTLSLTSALDGVGGQRHAPAALLLGTHCTGGWVGARAGQDGCGKSCPHRHSIP